ncbi:MAG: hypothetical protein QOC80_2692 [Frankiaceae bacterium]|nr:hypothetical protein [Frankiaceae bacterium]
MAPPIGRTAGPVNWWSAKRKRPAIRDECATAVPRRSSSPPATNKSTPLPPHSGVTGGRPRVAVRTVPRRVSARSALAPMPSSATPEYGSARRQEFGRNLAPPPGTVPTAESAEPATRKAAADLGLPGGSTATSRFWFWFRPKFRDTGCSALVSVHYVADVWTHRDLEVPLPQLSDGASEGSISPCRVPSIDGDPGRAFTTPSAPPPACYGASAWLRRQPGAMRSGGSLQRT